MNAWEFLTISSVIFTKNTFKAYKIVKMAIFDHEISQNWFHVKYERAARKLPNIHTVSYLIKKIPSKVGNTDKNTNEERKGGLTMKNSILRCAGSRAEPSCHVKVIPISQWVCKFLTLCEKATKRYRKSHNLQKRLFSIFG